MRAVFDFSPSSERVWDSFQRGLAILKEWDALWGSPWRLLVAVMGCFFSLFSELLSNKKTGRGNEATEAVFSTGNCESCTRPISTNPGSIEASEYRLTRWTCFIIYMPSRGGRGRRAAVDIVLCLGRGEFFGVFFFRFCFSSNAHGRLQVWGHLLPHLHFYEYLYYQVDNRRKNRHRHWVCWRCRRVERTV